MIVLRSPKGWTGPKEVDGKKVEGFWRAHQVPVANCREQSGASARSSKTGCAATEPEELFDANGTAACPICRRWRPRAAAAWAPIRTPTADC